MERMTIKEPQRRDIALEVTLLKSDPNLLELSFSSEYPVERCFGLEILDHSSTKSANLGRVLQGACPLLLNHNQQELIGKVEKAWIDTASRKGRALVRVSNSVAGQQALAQVKDGTLLNVSCYYSILEHEEEHREGQATPIVRATLWELIEISLVSVPQDPTVGIGRNFQKLNSGAKRMTVEPLNDRETEIKHILAMPAHWGPKIPGGVARAQQIANRAIAQGLSEEEARTLITEQIRGHKPQSISMPMPQFDMGLSAREREQYSLFNLIRSQVEPGYQGGGFELELHQEIMKRGLKPQNGGVFVPVNELAWNSKQQQRAFLAQGAGTANPLVPEQFLGGSFVEALRSTAYCLLLGTTVLEGLQGDVIIPRRTAIGAAGWVSENVDLPLAEGSFDQISMLPKTIGAYATFSRLAMVQTNPMIESLIKSDFIDAIARGIDKAIINGSGVGAEPRGLLNTPGIGSVVLGANGGAPTYGSMLDLEQKLSTANALTGSIGYLSTPQVTRKLKETLEFPAAGSKAVWQPDPEGRAGMGVSNGYKAAMSTNVPSTLTKGTGTNLSAIILANWADVILGQWGILEIVTNPYGAGFRKGEIEVRAMLFADINLRNAKSIAAVTDAITV
jgi:HK97 family phage major capsid protein